MMEQPAAPDTRHIGEGAEEGTGGRYKPYYVNSWAAVIGINNYEHLEKPLSYAVADAEGMANLLITRLGFLPENVFVVLDRPPQREPAAYQLYSSTATKATIEQLLLTDLPGKAKADDRVLIFFAGHGKRRSMADGATKGYLMPADARPGQWHEWVDIESVLDSNLYEAKHVFYLLDACYSGLAATRAAEETSRFEQDLYTRRARQVLTAGKDDQVVADTGGEGHSIFTNCVLEGLEGRLAAQEGSQVVTGFDLMRYVTRRVALNTNSLQTPDEGTRLGHKGGDFIFRLPDSALADLSPGEHMKLGCALYELGLNLESRGRFVSAIKQFEAALNQPGLDGSGIAEAWGWIGRCRMQLGEYQHAIEAFQRVEDLVADIGPADILLARAVAQAKLKDNARAVETLEDFLSRFPEHPYAGWAQSFRGAISERRAGRQIALLIGNGSYENRPGIRGQVPGLRQVKRDIDAVRRFLMEDCGYVPEDICVLADAEATRDGVIQALRSIAQRTTTDDTILIYRRGHGTRIKNKKGEGGSAAIEESVSVFYDYDFAKNGFLTAQEVHDLINQIPAREKVVITDEDHAGLDEYAQREGLYTLYQACSSDQTVSILPHEGAFTQALVGQMRAQGARLAIHGEIFQKVQTVLDLLNGPLFGTREASPHFVGDAQARFFQCDFQRWFCLGLWDLAETTLSVTLNPDALRRLFRELSSAYRGTAPAPTICRIGSALVEKGSYIDAASVFEYATTQLGCQDHRTLALFVQASFMAKQYALAKESVAKLQASWQLPEPQRGQLQELAEFLDMVVGQEQRAKLDALGANQRAWHKRDKRVDIEAEEEKTRHKFTELVAALVAPGFDEAIALLEKVVKRRKERFDDDYPEGQVNLGLFYGAARRFQDAVNHLTLYAEPAVTRVASKNDVLAIEWLRDMWLFMGRWLTNLGTATDLLLAVNKLERAYKLNYDDPAVGFYFSQALQNVVRLQFLPAARTNSAWYLVAGAPLGFEDDARQSVASNDEKGEIR